MSNLTADRVLFLVLIAAVLSGCDPPRPMHPDAEVKAGKICADAGLVPSTIGKPYLCIFPDNDPRLQ